MPKSKSKSATVTAKTSTIIPVGDNSTTKASSLGEISKKLVPVSATVSGHPTEDVSRVQTNTTINQNDQLNGIPATEEIDPNKIKSHVSNASVYDFKEIEIPTSRGQVSELEALAVSTIFQDLEEQSELFGKLLPSDMRTQSEFLSYEERFKKEVSEKEMEFLPVIKSMQNPFDIDENDLGTPEELELLKLQKDRRLLAQIVRQARRELEDNKTFKSLKGNVDRLQEWRNAAISLIDRYQESKMDLMELCKTMVNYAEEMSSAELDRKEIINFLKDKLHLTTQQGKQDQRYSRAFHEARNDHNLNQLSFELRSAESYMKYLETEMMRDKFCHRNVEDYFELVCWDTQKKIDHWNAKFDKDLEVIDKKVREKQDSIRFQQNQIEALSRMIEERMVELGPWEDQQRKERELRSDYLRLFFSARKIQRWWREYMVKHKLYKKKKGKKGKGKGKKGKGKGSKGKRKKSKK